MSDFDAQQVVDTLQFGSVPDSWKVFRAGPAYDVAQGSVWTLTAILLLGVFPAALVVSGLPTDSSDSHIFWVICSVFALPGLAFSYAAFRQFRRIPTAKEQWIALTPDGVVEYRGVKSGIVFSVAYSRLAMVSLIIGHTRYESIISLKVTYKSTPGAAENKRIFWRIDPRFPQREEIAQAIIEAHARYVANHTQTY